MRITIVSPPPNLSGGLRVVAIYAAKLAERGHHVSLVYPPPESWGLFRRMKRRMKGRGAPPARAPHSHFDNLPVIQHRLDRHRPVTADDLPDADVIVATWWETARWIAPLPPSKGRKIYFIQHHEVHNPETAEAVRTSYRLPLKKIVIARWLADLMQTEYGDAECDLVPNSVDLNLFQAQPRGRNAAPTVGLLYATTRWKGVDVVLAAIDILRREFPDLDVVSFGTPALRDDLPLPAGAHYVRQPPQEQLRALYSACDVWMSGTRSEGFGLTLLEAMACRCPAVSTRAGGPEDIIEDGVNGFLVPSEDHAALAERTAAILRLPETEWLRMSDAAFERATRYSWDDAADLFEATLLAAARG